MKIEKKTNVSIIIFLVLIIFIIVFVVYPLMGEIKKGSQGLISEKNQLSVLGEQINSLGRFKILYKNLEEILEKIDGLFVNKEVPVDFIGFLERTANKSYIDIEISPLSGGQTDTDPWPLLVFQITADGSFSQILSFLEKIENSPYLIEIQSLTISQISGEKNPAGNVKASFSFKVFAK